MEWVRYIHLNLIRAGIVKGLGGLNRSPWSGHSTLMGYKKREWQETGVVLLYFGKEGGGGSWGGGEFVERVLEEWDEVGRANLRLTGDRRSLSLLAQGVCENWGVTMEELRSGSRRKVLLKAREEFSQVAVKGLGYSGAEVARYLGVTGSCVTRIVAESQLSEEVKLRYQLR